MKTTNITIKLLISIINIVITFILSLPFLIYYGISIEWKILWIMIFLVYNIVVETAFGRCIGMMVLKARYEFQKSFWQTTLYVTLYTASFSTLLFYVRFPFDLLFINLLVQLLFILSTGTTLHGYLSGGVKTIKT